MPRTGSVHIQESMTHKGETGRPEELEREKKGENCGGKAM